MFVAKWEPGLTPSMPELTEVPLWLEFKGVPPQFFNEEGLEHVAGALGHPLYLHPQTASLQKFEVAKVFTIIDPLKLIPEVMNVQFESGHANQVEVTSALGSLRSVISAKKCDTVYVVVQQLQSYAHLANLPLIPQRLVPELRNRKLHLLRKQDLKKVLKGKILLEEERITLEKLLFLLLL